MMGGPNDHAPSMAGSRAFPMLSWLKRAHIGCIRWCPLSQLLVFAAGALRVFILLWPSLVRGPLSPGSADAVSAVGVASVCWRRAGRFVVWRVAALALSWYVLSWWVRRRRVP
eukprot:14676051-Alexandrium_andersonii.AAC.1